MKYVSINNLSFAYEEGKTILDNIDLDVDKGEFICILGQSGCGKSTLLRLIAGLEKPTTGTVSIDGEEVSGASLERGVVFQDYGLFPWMTAGKNILLALEQKYPKRKKTELRSIVLEKLREVGLDDSVYNKYPRELSGGMQQRCAIAQALSIESPLLLMDEPFGALDAVTRAALQDLIRNLLEGESRKTVFFVTHDVDEALLLGSRIIVLGPITGVMTVDKRYLEKAKTLELTGFRRFTKVVLPAASPAIFAGFTNSLRSSFVMLVFAEISGVQKGMGFFVKKYSTSGVFANTWAGFIFMAAVLVVVMLIFERIKKHVLRWTMN